MGRWWEGVGRGRRRWFTGFTARCGVWAFGGCRGGRRVYAILEVVRAGSREVFFGFGLYLLCLRVLRVSAGQERLHDFGRGLGGLEGGVFRV